MAKSPEFPQLSETHLEIMDLGSMRESDDRRRLEKPLANVGTYEHRADFAMERLGEGPLCAASMAMSIVTRPRSGAK